ncbi:MAG: HI0074 family nucleotidyltransferase substrate-binding subunit [Candidatus Tisiphia sp.]
MQHYSFINKLAKLDFIDEIWLFGSRMRGDNAERSDIDIAILCPNASRQDWDIVLEIVDNANTLLKIDCIRFNTLNENDALRNNILKFKKLLYSKNGNFMDKILWADYFYSLRDALLRLNDVLTHQDLEKIEYMQDAAIQRFEFVIELYWKVLKKILAYEKIESTTPRDILRKSFQFKLIDQEELWLSMLNDRNNTSHVYKWQDARKVFENIKIYYPVLWETYQKLAQHLDFLEPKVPIILPYKQIGKVNDNNS